MRRLFAVLVALVLWIPLALAAEADGHWQGTIQIPGAPLAVAIDLEGESGSIDIPAQGAQDLPLTDVEVAGEQVRFAIQGVPGAPVFEGTLSDDILEGTFTQGGQDFPFVLERAGEAEASDRVPTDDALAAWEALVPEVLEAFEVPGAAVAVVRDGEVVHVAGYGLADLETERPVGADTPFAIGSSTKAMTAMVIGTLVDEGLLAWDEPVKTYLPGFELHDPYATDHLTVRDLLTHRSGLPRHDLVWYGSTLSRHELYERLRHLEPSAELRATFQYQNLMYMTAGVLAEQVTGKPWERLVAERILAPLGMQDSTVGIAGLSDSEGAARGYSTEEVDGEDTLVAQPYRDLDAVGPAGSVNSTAADMARWLLLQLGDGALEGARIVAPTTLAALHQPQIVVHGGMLASVMQQPEMPHMMYAHGWFVQPYRGHEMIHHGGNIDGFSALVSFLPRDQAGIVVLTNKNGSTAPTVLALTLYDRLLGLDPVDWSGRYEGIQARLESFGEQEDASERLRVRRTKPSHELDAYTGTWRHPAYGEVVIAREGRKGLGFAFHTLDGPLEHWHYDTFRVADGDAEGTMLQFQADLTGYVDRFEATLEQGVEPIVFERVPPASLSEPEVLARYEGTYALDVGIRVQIVLRDDTLVAEVPGQPTYVLEPVREGVFDFAEHEGFQVRFEDQGGEVTGLLLVQPGAVLEGSRIEE